MKGFRENREEKIGVPRLLEQKESQDDQILSNGEKRESKDGQQYKDMISINQHISAPSSIDSLTQSAPPYKGGRDVQIAQILRSVTCTI